MRRTMAALAAIMTLSGGSELRWPDPGIRIPPRVEAFIRDECLRYEGTSGETLSDCIRGERYGYRAVVEMLTDRDTGDRAAGRYRGCAAGLGDFGGRFHRRKAECVGGVFGIVWRFEFSRRAALGTGSG